MFRWEKVEMICCYLDYLSLFCNSHQATRKDSSQHWGKSVKLAGSEKDLVMEWSTFLPLWLWIISTLLSCSILTWCLKTMNTTSLNNKPPIILNIMTIHSNLNRCLISLKLHSFLSHQNGCVLLAKQPSHQFPVQPLLTVWCMDTPRQ